MKRIVWIMALVVLLPSVLLAAGWKEIAPQRVYHLLEEGSGLWLIDVRGPAAFERGHIEGAVNIPAVELAMKRFAKRKVLVLADHGLGELKAKQAAALLVKNGQERVFVLAGGLGGWQRAGLPVVGPGSLEPVRVMPQELSRALQQKAPLRLLDLREAAERRQGLVAEAEAVAGKNLAEKLAKVRRNLEQQEKKSLAARLKIPPTTVLLFPVAADAGALIRRHLWGLAADVRYVEGGYLAAAPRQKLTVSNVEGCPTCPGE